VAWFGMNVMSCFLFTGVVFGIFERPCGKNEMLELILINAYNYWNW
jgi:hypothetical protein